MTGRPREGNYKIISVNLEPDETDKFVQRLKHNQSLSEIFRDFIRDENRRVESEKNLKAQNNGAIKSVGQANNVSIYRNKNLSLDLFTIQRNDIPDIIYDIERKGILGKFMGDAKLILSCSKKQIDRL